MKEAKFPPTTHLHTGTSPKGFFNGLDLVYCAGGGFDFFFMQYISSKINRLITCLVTILGREEAPSTSSLKLHLKKGGSLLCKVFPWVLSKAVQHVGNIPGTPLTRQ